MGRLTLIANWKMYLTPPQSERMVGVYEKILDVSAKKHKYIVCPSYTAIASVRQKMKFVRLGAQNCSRYKRGAYTGQISCDDLYKAGCRSVIIGHSEVREHCDETDEASAQKAVLALQSKLQPIICVGESLKIKKLGQSESYVRDQMSFFAKSIPRSSIKDCLFAYEPIWAIGSGVAEQAEVVVRMFKHIRHVLDQHFGAHAEGVTIVYGGSVRPNNMSRFLEKPEIQGFLVGLAGTQPNAVQKMLKIFESRG